MENNNTVTGILLGTPKSTGAFMASQPYPWSTLNTAVYQVYNTSLSADGGVCATTLSGTDIEASPTGGKIFIEQCNIIANLDVLPTTFSELTRDQTYSDCTRYSLSLSATASFLTTYPDIPLAGHELATAASAKYISDSGGFFTVLVGANEPNLLQFCRSQGWNIVVVEKIQYRLWGC